MFTDRFILIPITLYNRKQKDEQGLKNYEEVDAKAKINPLCIESYREAIPDGSDITEESKTCTVVMMKSGDAFEIEMTIAEFEVILNKHQQ